MNRRVREMPSESSESWAAAGMLRTAHSDRDAFHEKRVGDSAAWPFRPLPEESNFYDEYPWCVNIFPTIQEAALHLRHEVKQLDAFPSDWRRQEVALNVYLLSCGILDSANDFLLGSGYDFSMVASRVTFLKPLFQFAEWACATVNQSRELLQRTFSEWERRWELAVLNYLEAYLNDDQGKPGAVRDAAAALLPLLDADLPDPFLTVRLKVPALFHARDFTHVDYLRMAEEFIVAHPERQQPILIVGLRTAGSYIAPLICAFLRRKGYTGVEFVTLRPKRGLRHSETTKFKAAAREKCLAVIVDEPPHTGGTLETTTSILRKFGFDLGRVTALLPIDPVIRDWKSSFESQTAAKLNLICLEPERRQKVDLLKPECIGEKIQEYLALNAPPGTRTLTVCIAKQPSSELRKLTEEKVDNRLKQVFEVHLQPPGEKEQIRLVFAKSVGWGWLGYHAFRAAEQLSQFVPPLLGLRDGILFTEWIVPRESSSWDSDREGIVRRLASYIGARARSLSMGIDPSPDLSRENRHQGFALLATVLSGAYNSKILAALSRPRIQRQVSAHPCPAPTFIDGRMRHVEWIYGAAGLLKTDFEHHCQGKRELDVSDPAFDLSEAIVHFGLSRDEESSLISSYIKESGDAGVKQRLLLYKLLDGTWNMIRALASLNDSRLLHRHAEFHRKYIAAWNLLVIHMTRFCGSLSNPPVRPIWRSPLVVLDIDGVLDRMVFGFPGTTAAGIRAIALLHAHESCAAVNSARSLMEVREYCKAYGFAGGVAEYGSVIWDSSSDKSAALVSGESLGQLQRVRDALLRIPGVFLNDDYQFSIRAFTYQRGRTAPLPTLMIQNLLAQLNADRLCIHQTDLDSAILAKETDKGKGLRALLEFVGQGEGPVYAIGDSEPDLPMFKVASKAFAPAQISCRKAAQSLGCEIARSRYQPGLLEIVRQIVHPNGGQCGHCRSAESKWTSHRDFLTGLLEIADRKPRSLLLRVLLDPLAVQVFKK